ncbi:MAG: fimbrillin family protein [Candidatus Cryptobacteroides sp.]|nr:fimbrillin family protein [Candidatus Cryptobacteroides sp.]
MKKSLIIALGAIALVACTKTSVSYEQTGEIGFAPVVRKNSTKAAVHGAVQGTTFPEQNIKVFGYYDNSMPVGSAYKDGNFAVEYLPGVEFAKKGKIWAGANDNHYYWPKTGSMLFAGYSPVDFDGVTFSLASNKFSVDTLVQPDFSATKDLLYAGRGTSVLGGTVDMVFSHALSWVTVKAKAADANEIKITNIKFVGLAAKGYSAGLPAWSVKEARELNVFAPTSAFDVPADTTLVESHKNCGLVFPQNLTDAAEIVVSYEMNNGAGKWFAQYPFVKKLNSLKSGADTINMWEAGKHYTYIINFSTIKGGPDSSNEITINPSITDWTPVNVDGISAN